jgi:shikimate kinase
MTARVVLVGLPATGKTTTGRRLAKILAVDFVDSDELVEAATSRSVRDIFAEDGEAAFRAAESDAIVAALAGRDGVLALGGGALTAAATREALLAAGIPVVLLQAGIDTLTDRVGDAHTRPLLTDDPPARLRQLAAERDATYRSCATLVVDTDGRSPGQVAAVIAARLHEQAVRP